MNISVGVVRALIVEDEPLLRAELSDQLAALWPELVIAGVAENGIEAVALLETLRPDIVFLDIQIPGLNGMEVARHVAPTAQIVFVTAYAEHALRAFEAGAADYLVKPLAAARLLHTVKRLKARSAGAQALAPELWQQAFPPRAATHLKWIKASVGASVRLLPVAEVHYFQAEDKYTRVVTNGADALIRVPLKNLITQLDPAQFAQIHRAAIVNLQSVDRIERQGAALEIHLKGRRDKLAVSEAYARQFRQM